MTFKPYNLKTYSRPTKYCFLVDAQSDKAIEIVKEIISICRKKWGGAYTPIILFNHADPNIDEEYRKFLYKFDPDIVISTFKPDADNDIINNTIIVTITIIFIR
jgi:hypothetical protein